MLSYPFFSPDLSYSPSRLLDVQETHLDDSHIPLIPITPIEEEGAVDLPFDMAATQNASFDLQSLALPQDISSGNLNAPQCDPPASLKPSANAKPALVVQRGFQADVVAAAAAAMTAIMKSKEQVNLIDTDLLIKFLSDPKMIAKLISEQGAPASNNTEPISGSKPLTASMPLPSTKPGLVEELINESVAIPCPKPDPVSIHRNRAPTDAGAAAVSGTKLATSPVAFASPRPHPVVNNWTNGHGVSANAGSAPFSVGKLASPLGSLPSSKPDLIKIKRMINEYGTLDGNGTENEPISWWPVSSPKLDVALPTWTNSHPLPNAWETGLQLKAFSQDAARPNLNRVPNVMQPDLRQKALSPDSARLNMHPLPNVVQPSLQKKALSPDTVPISSFSAMKAPLLALSPLDTARLNLLPLPNVSQPNLQMKPDTAPRTSFSAGTAPPVKDIKYVKSLIKQHGEMQETQDYDLLQSGNFRVHLQDPIPIPTLKLNELTSKVQKPCIFFNGLKGCRNGSNCLFRHDKAKNSQPGGVVEAPSAKKMKLGGEITGRT